MKGYSPRDAVRYDFLTSLAGVLEKHTGEEPFDVPAKLREAFPRRGSSKYRDARLGDVPVDFLSTNDITGGNSGSPALNGRGEVIGAVFDTDWEGVASDHWYLPERTRAIHVDIRYVLFLLDEVCGARNVLEELTLR